MGTRHALALVVAAAAGCGSRSAPPRASDQATCVVARVVTADGVPPSGARVELALHMTPNPDGSESTASARIGSPTSQGDVCGDVSWNSVKAPAVSIIAGHEGRAYEFGPFAVAPTAAACGSGACTDVGVLALTPDRRLPVTVCQIAGVVQDVNGQPMANANVSASDASVPSDAVGVLCVPDASLCHAGAVSDAAGRFAFPALVTNGPTLQSRRLDTSDPVFDRVRTAELAVDGCPPAPVTLTASGGFDVVRSLAVALNGPEISWSGGFLAAEIRVDRGDVTKWSVVATSGGIAAPVIYGRVPPGGEQRSPLGFLPPPPLASGDEISVLVSGTAPDGFPFTGVGSVVVP